MNNSGELYSQIITCHRQQGHPQKCARDIIKDEFAEVELDYAGKYGRKGTNNWDKAAYDQCCTTVFVVEFFGHDHIFTFEKKGILSFEEHRACSMAKPISRKIAQYTRYQDSKYMVVISTSILF